MKICPACQLEFDDKYVFCHKCGEKLKDKIETVFCPYCGNKMETEGEFCPYCGKLLVEDRLKAENKVSLIVTDKIDTVQPTVKKNYVKMQPLTKNTSMADDNKSDKKDVSPGKWAIIVVLFIVNAVAGLIVDTLVGTYRMNSLRSDIGLAPRGSSLSGGDLMLWVLGTYLLIAGSLYILKGINSKAAQVFKILFLFGITVKLVCRFL